MSKSIHDSLRGRNKSHDMAISVESTHGISASDTLGSFMSFGKMPMRCIFDKKIIGGREVKLGVGK